MNECQKAANDKPRNMALLAAIVARTIAHLVL